MKKIFLIVFFLVLFAFLLNILASLGILEGASGVVAPISNFINDNKYIFIFWHIVMYFAIFKTLRVYANYIINKGKISEYKKNEAIKFCYIAVSFVIVIDILYAIGRII